MKFDKQLFLSLPIVGGALDPCNCLKGNFIASCDVFQPMISKDMKNHSIRNCYYTHLGSDVFGIQPFVTSVVSKKLRSLLDKYETKLIKDLGTEYDDCGNDEIPRDFELEVKEQIKLEFVKELEESGLVEFIN